MAKIISGPDIGKRVTVMDLDGPKAVLHNRNVINLSRLLLDHDERKIVIANYKDSPTFKFYDWDMFIEHNRFKQLRGARRSANGW